MAQRVGRDIALLFLDRGTRRGVSGQQHAPAALYPREPIQRVTGGSFTGSSSRGVKLITHLHPVQRLRKVSRPVQGRPYLYPFYSSSRTRGGPSSGFRQFEKDKPSALTGSYRVALRPHGSKHVTGRQMCGHEHDTVARAHCSGSSLHV